MADDRIEKIRKVVQNDDEEQARPDIENIIKRLKSAENETHRPAVGGGQFKERLEGKQSTNLDFSKKSFTPTAGQTTTAQSGSLISFVGKFYAAFQKPTSFLANVVSKMPGVSALHSDLEAADMNLSVEAYIIISTVIGILVALASVPVVSLIIAAAKLNLILLATIPIIAVFVFIFTAIIALYYPKTIISDKTTKINRDLPFALRHLSTQIKAGVSFHRALASVTASDYGELSKELKKTLKELERGSSTDEALLNLAKRTRSAGLKKAVIQIIRALKTGGNLSAVINDIADDSAFEYQMRLRDFVEKLNIVNVVFTMIAVVGPVTIKNISAVAQLPMIGGALPFSMVIAMLAADVVAMIVIVWFITKMESSI